MQTPHSQLLYCPIYYDVKYYLKEPNSFHNVIQYKPKKKNLFYQHSDVVTEQKIFNSLIYKSLHYTFHVPNKQQYITDLFQPIGLT